MISPRAVALFLACFTIAVAQQFGDDGVLLQTQSVRKSREVAGLQCQATCYERTCDDWVNTLGQTCDTLTSTAWGCDCSSCSSCNQVPAPSPSATCTATCFEKTCNDWVQEGFACDVLTGSWGCDCSSCSSCNQVPAPTPPFTPQPADNDDDNAYSFAVIPVKWKVITKYDGTGTMKSSDIAARMDGLNARFRGQDIDTSEMAKIVEGTDCKERCRAALCFQDGAAFDQSTKDKVESECFCSSTTNNKFCEQSGYNELQGPYQNTGIQFTLVSVDHVANDEWYSQCCCAGANFQYEIKQNEIFDQVIDKATVRSVATLIICDMTTLGGGTSGQSIVSGGNYCNGGPGLMIDRGALDSPGYAEDTLAHEFGHYLGLYHTFNSKCPNGSCQDWEVCTEANKGDFISDTPTHKKQGKCPQGGADSCPNLPGTDPLDNFMSYSDCPLLRFTPEQVQVMQKTVSDYYPPMLTNSGGQQPKDLPCNPNFPDKVVPSGYALPW